MSQASTKIPGSQTSTTQLNDTPTHFGEHSHEDIIQGDQLGLGKLASVQEPIEKPGYVFDVDGLQYSRPGPAWTETTDVPKEHLGFIQVAAFMINQTIGTGIFSTPGYILLLTRSKSVTVALWIAGGAYSLLRYMAPVNRLPSLISSPS